MTSVDHHHPQRASSHSPRSKGLCTSCRVRRAHPSPRSTRPDVVFHSVADLARGATSSALMASDVNIFRHEFITIFRYSHSASVNPADMHILEAIEDRAALYEEEKGTVFLARDVVARMQKLAMDARRASAPPPHHHHHRSSSAFSRPRYVARIH